MVFQQSVDVTVVTVIVLTGAADIQSIQLAVGTDVIDVMDAMDGGIEF